MGFDLYAIACNEFLSELKESLTKEDVDVLRTDCAAVGWKKWCQWTGKNLSIIRDYAQLTPSQRLKKKLWQDPVIKRALVLASIQYLHGAKHLLESLSEHNIVPGKSYRHTVGLAGYVYLECFSRDIPRWPFDGPNPFSE
jgi:hypothetical protein